MIFHSIVIYGTEILGQIPEFETLGLFHNTVMERSWPMSEFLISRDEFFKLYLAFEINPNYLFVLLVKEKTFKKLEANCL